MQLCAWLRFYWSDCGRYAATLPARRACQSFFYCGRYAATLPASTSRVPQFLPQKPSKQLHIPVAWSHRPLFEQSTWHTLCAAPVPKPPSATTPLQIVSSAPVSGSLPVGHRCSPQFGPNHSGCCVCPDASPTVHCPHRITHAAINLVLVPCGGGLCSCVRRSGGERQCGGHGRQNSYQGPAVPGYAPRPHVGCP